MGFFGKNRETGCCCKGNVVANDANHGKADGNAVGIRVLGSGCAKCQALEAAVKEALIELGMTDAVEHVTDFGQIAAYGVMTTPALVVDGKVVSYGKVLKKDEAMALIRQARGQ